MKNARSDDLTRQHGFTLIELLVAMAVLGLLVGLLSKMASMSLSTWSRSEKVLSSGDIVRPLEERIGNDFALMTTYGNLPRFRDGASADSRLGFFVINKGEVLPGTTPRKLSYIEYEWDKSKSELARNVKGFSWSDIPEFRSANSTESFTPNFVVENSPIQGVLAFNVVFLDETGTPSLKYDSTSSHLARIAFVQVSRDARRILEERGKLDGVVNGLVLTNDELVSATPPLLLWKTRIDSMLSNGNLPSALSSALQPVQLTFAIPQS